MNLPPLPPVGSMAPPPPPALGGGPGKPPPPGPAQAAKPMTLAEQLAAQKLKLQEAKKENVNQKVLNMSDDKKIALQTNLAQLQQQIENRKKLLGGPKNAASSDDDDSSNGKSDGSGW